MKHNHTTSRGNGNFRLIDQASRFCLAPMMGWTDRHCRFFLRLMTQKSLLYTEMITADALIHGNREKFLAFSPAENPIALQIGGSSPPNLGIAARMVESSGYQEINLNIGCPSHRVQNGHFGVCLMAEPRCVADCVAALCDSVSIPVTVKCRIGIDNQDSEAFLTDFIGTVSEAGCHRFIVHARKAWLNGLSPKENRNIPPLDYNRVYRLKNDFKHLSIVLNGGIRSVTEARSHLDCLDGVMLGRAVYENPWLLSEVDETVFGMPPRPVSKKDIVSSMIPYIECQLAEGIWLNHITRHMLNLFSGVPGARKWRRILSEESCLPGADIRIIEKAMQAVNDD